MRNFCSNNFESNGLANRIVKDLGQKLLPPTSQEGVGQLLGHSIGRRDRRLIMPRRCVGLSLAFCSLILSVASDPSPPPTASSKDILTVRTSTARTSVTESSSVSMSSRRSSSTMEITSSSGGSDLSKNVVNNTRETTENTSSITPTSNKAAVTETEFSSTMIAVNTTSSDNGIQTTTLNNTTAKLSESELTSSENSISCTVTPTVPTSTTQTNSETDSTMTPPVVIQSFTTTVTSQVNNSVQMNDESSDEHTSRRVLWLILGVGGGCMLSLAFLATFAFQFYQSRTKRSWVIPKDTHEIANGRHANGCHDNPGMESSGLSENGNGMGGACGDKEERPARESPDSWVVPLEVMTSMQEAAARLVNDTQF